LRPRFGHSRRRRPIPEAAVRSVGPRYFRFWVGSGRARLERLGSDSSRCCGTYRTTSGTAAMD